MLCRERCAVNRSVSLAAARREQALVETDNTADVVFALNIALLQDNALDNIYDGIIGCAGRTLVLADDTADVVARTRNGCGYGYVERTRPIRLCVCDV